jgi:hypothetical protein
MITYQDWKLQRQIVEANVSADKEIENLIQSTANDIAHTVQNYIDMTSASRTQQRSVPEQPPKQPSMLQKIGRAITPDLNAPVKGSLLPHEKGTTPTRLDRLRHRAPAIGSMLTPQPDEEKKGWFSKLTGRLGNVARNFWMNKENTIIPEDVFSIADLKSVLLENGIKEIFLMESDSFDKLNRSISAHLHSFVDSLQKITGNQPAKQQTRKITGNKPSPGNPVIASAPPIQPEEPKEEKPAQQKNIPQENNVIKVAKNAIRTRGRSTHLARFLKLMEIPVEQANKVVSSLIKNLGIRKGSRNVVKGILDTGMFPDEVLEAIRNAS